MVIKDLEFDVGGHVYLKIASKLSQMFVGAFEILHRIEQVMYKLMLPPSVIGVHNAFHMFMLHKHAQNSSHAIA